MLPHTSWTLVGGLMAQVHAAHRGIDALRPTVDVDMVLHIETQPHVAAEAVRALGSLGYVLSPGIDARRNTAHRFVRTKDVADVVDVLVADHASPRTRQRLSGREMVAIEGGTQALRRTVNARLSIDPSGAATTISVPAPFAATILKAAAYQADSRDRARHLTDAVVLLAAIEQPLDERSRFAGSDRSRLQTLRRALPDDARPWQVLPPEWRAEAQAALRLLCG